MSSSPTPEEARQALHDVDRRREQSARAAGHSRWAWLAAGVVTAAYGVLADREPRFLSNWSSIIVVALLLIVVAGNTRRGGALLGRPVRARTAADPASMLWVALVLILFIAAATLAVALHTPHAAVWIGLAGGVLLAAAGPWWQRRVLSRAAGR